ncbi:MAG: DUF4845 domain-containing protein [Clostridia bacterium]
MLRTQRGVSLVGLIMGLFILVIGGIFGMKLIPAYIEFYKIKAAVVAIAADKSKTSSVAEIKKAFSARSSIDDIESVKPDDLEISKQGADVVIGFSYRKEVTLGGNVGLYIDFKGDSKGD